MLQFSPLISLKCFGIAPPLHENDLALNIMCLSRPRLFPDFASPYLRWVCLREGCCRRGWKKAHSVNIWFWWEPLISAPYPPVKTDHLVKLVLVWSRNVKETPCNALVSVIRLCGTDPKASARSKKVICTVFFLLLASLTISSRHILWSIQPLMPGKNAFCNLSSI